MAKEILKDEILTYEQLDSVSRGTIPQTALDSEFLYEHGLMNDWHNGIYTIFHWESHSAAVDEGWSKAGITCVSKHGANFSLENYNQYFINGKQISRDEAHRIVDAKFPQIRRVD